MGPSSTPPPQPPERDMPALKHCQKWGLAQAVWYLCAAERSLLQPRLLCEKKLRGAWHLITKWKVWRPEAQAWILRHNVLHTHRQTPL